MNLNHYTYRVTWSEEDQEHVGLCAEFPSLSWLDTDPAEALRGIMHVVAEAVNDMQANGEQVPEPLAERSYSGHFAVRVPPMVHRKLALEAAEKGVSMNRPGQCQAGVYRAHAKARPHLSNQTQSQPPS